jgi:hypothetical protein
MLESNKSRVQNLTGLEIWFFIIGRVFVGFGIGILAMAYFPSFALMLAWPVILAGIAIMLIASRGLFRKKPQQPTA